MENCPMFSFLKEFCASMQVFYIHLTSVEIENCPIPKRNALIST